MENSVYLRRGQWLRIAAALVCLSSGVLTAQTATAIDTIDHRPLASALAKAEAVLGIAINYEDVPYENLSDLEDVSTVQQRSAYPGYRLLVPRKGQVNATIQSYAAMLDGERILNVDALLSSYRASRLPGDFAVEQANGMLYVVPTQVLGANGSTRSVQSLMKTLVTVPDAERTVAETVTAILQSVSSATRARIAVGCLPFLPKDIVRYGVSRKSARDALAELFSKLTARSVFYQLLFDPATAYMLNVWVTPSAGSPAPEAPQAEPPSSGGSRFFSRN
jgi:hypothetical protein